MAEWMSEDDFSEISRDHQQIWLNDLALFNREITEKNLMADNWLAANRAEGIAAHEMGACSFWENPKR